MWHVLTGLENKLGRCLDDFWLNNKKYDGDIRMLKIITEDLKTSKEELKI